MTELHASPSVGTLDHIVVTVPELASALDACEQRLGVRPEPGGEHPQFGTHNALLTLGGDSYIELIARRPDSPDVVGPIPFGLDQQPTKIGVCTFAAHPAQLNSAAEQVRGSGIELGDATDGERTAPDGTTLRWRLTRPLAGADAGVEPAGAVPFLIDWGDTPSPAHTVAPKVRLVDWGIASPEPDRVRRVLDIVEVPVPVIAGHARIWVELEGPTGRWRIG